jgi:hypothetical protein
MYEQSSESAHACVVKYIRARLPSQGREPDSYVYGHLYAFFFSEVFNSLINSHKLFPCSSLSLPPQKIRVYIYIHTNIQMLRWAQCLYNFHRRIEKWTLISYTLKELSSSIPCLLGLLFELKTEAVRSFETSENIYQYMRRNLPETLLDHRYENLKSHKYEHATFQTRRSLRLHELHSSLCLFTANGNLLKS